LRSVPEAGRPREQVENHGRAYTQVLFLPQAELGFFHFLEIVTGWLVPSAGLKIPLQPGWYLPPQKIPLAEIRFLQAGKGAENTKEKSRQCFASALGSSFCTNMLQEVTELQHPLAEISLGYCRCLHGLEQLPKTSEDTVKEDGRSDRLQG
jgi:hypothetical protein